ncbi:hypothetical protein V2J09_016298 [Rumex salicifolius]
MISVEFPLLDQITPKSVFSTTSNDLSNWSRLSSLWPPIYGTRCCFIEFASLIGSRFDFDRYGQVLRSSPRQADLILIASIVTMKMAPSLVRLYEQILEPKYVIAMGACTIIGGCLYCRGVDKLVLVDIYLSGYPPKPEADIDAITKLRKKISWEIYEDRIQSKRKNRCFTIKHKGPVLSAWLVKRGLRPYKDWHSINVILYVYGYNYLRSQCAYDIEPGGLLASVYHLTRIDSGVDQPEEIWKSVDFQERESYDMLGILYDNHPRLKRILMPESWIGWHLRKDYIAPNFYEIQDAF